MNKYKIIVEVDIPEYDSFTFFTDEDGNQRIRVLWNYGAISDDQDIEKIAESVYRERLNVYTLEEGLAVMHPSELTFHGDTTP